MHKRRARNCHVWRAAMCCIHNQVSYCSWLRQAFPGAFLALLFIPTPLHWWNISLWPQSYKSYDDLQANHIGMSGMCCTLQYLLTMDVGCTLHYLLTVKSARQPHPARMSCFLPWAPRGPCVEVHNLGTWRFSAPPFHLSRPAVGALLPFCPLPCSAALSLSGMVAREVHCLSWPCRTPASCGASHVPQLSQTLATSAHSFTAWCFMLKSESGEWPFCH